jgi:Na+/proline symporter
MLFSFSTVDTLLLTFGVLAMLVIGLFFFRDQHSSKDFLIGDRSLAWWPVGLSVMATIISGIIFVGVPGDAYFVGLKMLAAVAAVWLVLPLLLGLVLPIYYNMQIYSIFEYLELRYGLTTQLVGSILFASFRLLWITAILAFSSQALVVAAGWSIPVTAVIAIVGIVVVLYTYLGGMKAVVWTDVLQALAVIVGVLVLIWIAWTQLDKGAADVAESIRRMQRTDLVDFSGGLTNSWSLWAIIPFFAVVYAALFVADQATVQRLLSCETLKYARRSVVLGCLGVTFVVPMLIYAGLAMLTVYQHKDHRQNVMPARWVVNFDAETGNARTSATGEPLITWDEPVNSDTLESLIAERRLIDPSRKKPFESSSGLVDQDNNLVLRKLCTNNPKKKEWQIHPQARDEIVPHFIKQFAPVGLAGLLALALLAAAMSSIDSGLNSLSSFVVVDLLRTHGWGQASLAAKLGKEVDELSEVDELKPARKSLLIAGVAMIVGAVAMAQFPHSVGFILALGGTLAGPLTAVFLVGMLSQRPTQRSALVGLATGIAVGLGLTFATGPDSLSPLWPTVFAFVTTAMVSWILGFLLGGHPSTEDLRGLTLGVGHLGEIDPPDAHEVIDTSFDIDIDDRWQ